MIRGHRKTAANEDALHKLHAMLNLMRQNEKTSRKRDFDDSIQSIQDIGLDTPSKNLKADETPPSIDL